MPKIVKKVSKLKNPENISARILSSAIELFSIKGYQNTSTQQIADMAGIQQPQLFYYFKTKELLFESSIIQIIRNNEQIVLDKYNPYDNAYDAFQKYFFGNIKWALENRKESQ